MILPLLAALLAQVTPVQPLVKGTGLAPQDGDTAAVMATADAWLAALNAGDAAALREKVTADGGTTVAETGHAARRQGWPAFLAGLAGTPRPIERFAGPPAAEVDGDIAMVWGDYTRSGGGAVTACGVEHLDLIREDGAWKIQSETRSQRTAGCAA